MLSVHSEKVHGIVTLDIWGAHINIEKITNRRRFLRYSQDFLDSESGDF